MKLHHLKPAPGSRTARRRVGRGIAAGQGKTAGRGTKGYLARNSSKQGFEGGQMPLFRRLPKKKHFTLINPKEFASINVRDLNDMKAGTTVTYELLREQGIISDDLGWGFRVLGDGELKVAINVRAHHFTAGAKTKIEAAGGTATVVTE